MNLLLNKIKTFLQPEPDLAEDLGKIVEAGTSEHLRVLHGVTRGNIESGHIPLDVVVADHRDEAGHLEAGKDLLREDLGSRPEATHVSFENKQRLLLTRE